VTGPLAVIQADVFTSRPFAGNPAVAVLDADGLDEAAMQRIAAELRAPGTAFVSASTRPDAEWRLRMFTPRREVGYSGHTALGATHALLEAGRLTGAQVVFDTFGIRLPERRRLSPRMYEHQIMGDHAMASFRIGVAESNGRFALLNRDELLKHPSMPERTRNSKAPDFIPLGDTVVSENGKVVGHAIRPDREMFVIRDLEKGVSYFFPGFEIGTGSETHRPTKPRHDHSLTESKFADYITIIDKEIYHSHFGAPNFFIPFIEPNMHRIQNMMALWNEMTRTTPWVRPSALFKTHHAYTEKYHASGRMLTEPFLIVGEDGRTTQFSVV